MIARQQGAADDPRPAAPSLRVELVTSSGCHYCGHAREVLDRLGAEVRLEVTEVDLDSPAGQAALARWRVPFPPIVILDGDLFGYGRVSERKLRQALTARGA
jgi:glutaredoxin